MAVKKGRQGRRQAIETNWRGGERFLPIPDPVRDVLGSLPPHEAKLMLALQAQLYRNHVGDWNNGALAIVWRQMAERGFKSRDTLQQAQDGLEGRDLIIKTRQGGRNRCNLWGLTFFAIDSCIGKDLDIGPTTHPLNTWRKHFREAPLKTTADANKHAQRVNAKQSGIHAQRATTLTIDTPVVPQQMPCSATHTPAGIVNGVCGMACDTPGVDLSRVNHLPAESGTVPADASMIDADHSERDVPLPDVSGTESKAPEKLAPHRKPILGNDDLKRVVINKCRTWARRVTQTRLLTNADLGHLCILIRESINGDEGMNAAIDGIVLVWLKGAIALQTEQAAA